MSASIPQNDDPLGDQDAATRLRNHGVSSASASAAAAAAAAAVSAVSASPLLGGLPKKRLRKSPTCSKISKASCVKLRSAPISKRFRSRSLPNIWIPSSRQTDLLLTDLSRRPGLSAKGGANLIESDVSQCTSNSAPQIHSDISQALSASSSIHRRHRCRHHPSSRGFGSTATSGTSSTLVLGSRTATLTHQFITRQQLLMPPVNLQSMHEIDLHEVLKNPQLRHDILFDPQLQFRPNIDGERGKRKKTQADTYWSFIRGEIKSLLADSNPKPLTTGSPITVMFQALKSILLSLIPSKDKASVEDILDMKLILQQLNSHCFDFTSFADWISSALKHHCAPMRDVWVDNMNAIFQSACENGTDGTPPTLDVDRLVDGLRMVFSILEAMKLDVANHQIRILRPLLCSTAVSFEKEYFNNALKRGKVNFTLALLWFKKNSIVCRSSNVREVLNFASLHLLSCSSMCSEFPNTLAFDHSRLVVLRADIRHLICTKLCTILYKNLVMQYAKSRFRDLCSTAHMFELKKEILNIIVDENGNSKWTRNLHNLAVHLTFKLFGNLNAQKVDFCFNWLLAQTQPSSKVYTLLEQTLFEKILKALNEGTVSQIEDDCLINEELKNVAERLNQLIELNYNVFGEIYGSYLD
ncbi:hypothetical protein FOA43_002315 [Brettanomyces nanus]|uniref:Uncharacterized protein n=1 Tax=Eeniella nana TaxID=13502 RepID=A0A875S0Q0_EENNA|nr:uncharacterized protein FOA43_002315 [Brettanomyces nanus]QPG74976.1 hypothetical protein FOA43_002315 [Brettanomyces nanus]